MAFSNIGLRAVAKQFKEIVGKEHEAYKIARAAVEASQTYCPHKKTQSVVAETNDLENKKFSAGDTVEWCPSCGAITNVIVAF